MRKIIGIGGESATGKSTLLKSLVETLGPASDWHRGTLSGPWYPEAQVMVLGAGGGVRYQAHAQLFLQVLPAMAEYRDLVVLFEGAPLFNISFLTYCKVKIASTVPSTLVYALETSEATLDYRRRQRGDKQTRRCLRERAAKIKAILKDFPHAVRLRSESLEDLEKNVEVLREAIFK